MKYLIKINSSKTITNSYNQLKLPTGFYVRSAPRAGKGGSGRSGGRHGRRATQSLEGVVGGEGGLAEGSDEGIPGNHETHRTAEGGERREGTKDGFIHLIIHAVKLKIIIISKGPMKCSIYIY